MVYEIKYGGCADRGFISIISGIGVSSIRKGDSFSISIDSDHYAQVSIAYEMKDNEGFIKWTDVKDSIQTLTDGESYEINEDYADNYFFRIILRRYKKDNNGKLQLIDLLLGEKFDLTIRTENEKIAKSFLSSKATMISPTISRKCTTIKTEHNYVCANIIGNTNATYDHFTTTSGKNKGTNLMWYKTSDDNFLSTLCYVKNLHSEPLKLCYTIQGHVVKSDGSGEIWRSPSINENGTDSGYGRLSTIINRGETKLLEYCVRIRGDISVNNGVEQYKCWINDSNGKHQDFNLDLLFWRFDIGEINEKVEPSHFIILNEKLRDGGDLANSIRDHSAIEFTVIDQQTLK